MIRSQSGVLKQIIAAVTKLDLACARAEHARWIRGTMPHIFSSSQKQIEGRDQEPWQREINKIGTGTTNAV